MIRTLIYITAFIFLTGIVVVQYARADTGVAGHTADEPQFFSSIQDIPLMPGLTELTDQMVVFDKPEGRIVESVALLEMTDVTTARSYYEAVLPQFGWSKVTPALYARDDEHLRMDFEEHGGQDFLRITVAPRLYDE